MKTLSAWLVILGFCLGSYSTLHAQEYFRIQGEFSIKGKSDSISTLTMGKFYYDKNQKLLVYDISFPKQQLWVFADTSVYRFEGDELLERVRGMAVHEFSIFHLAANNHLSHYGLNNSLYNLAKVEKEGKLVISTWEPPAVINEIFGKVMISNQDKRIQGVLFFDKEDQILRKQFFKGYQNYSGLEFPTEIVDIFYLPEDGKSLQKTIYKNIVVNETNNSRFYTFELPAGYRALFAN